MFVSLCVYRVSDLEEDPFFSDSLLLSDNQLLLSPTPPPPLPSSDPLPPPGLGSATDVVNR